MRYQPSKIKTKQKVACAVTLLFDLILISFLITCIGLYIYPDKKARTFWKVGFTCNSLVLWFEFRMRLLCCWGYPLKNMLDLGVCCVFTRIRMKLADYFCFFYIFFAEVIVATILVSKQYKSPKE